MADEPLTNINADYDGYLLYINGVNRGEFKSVDELNEFVADIDDELVADPTLDYTVNEWPDGTWLIIHARTSQ